MRQITLDSLQLSVQESGSGDVTLLFLHGITANHRIWDPIVNELSGHYRCVSVDQRGHGRSDAPESGYRDLDYSDDIRGLADEVSPTQRVVLVGHSLGARNALVAAHRFPDRVSGVVAIDFTPYTPLEELDLIVSRLALAPDHYPSRQALHDFLAPRYPLLSAEAIDRRIDGGFDEHPDGRLTPRAAKHALEQTAQGLYADLEGPVSALTVPTLLIRGSESPVVPEDAYLRTLTLNPLLTGVVVEGTDHFVPEERPHEVAGLITDFIRRLSN